MEGEVETVLVLSDLGLVPMAINHPKRYRNHVGEVAYTVRSKKSKERKIKGPLVKRSE